MAALKFKVEPIEIVEAYRSGAEWTGYESKLLLEFLDDVVRILGRLVDVDHTVKEV